MGAPPHREEAAKLRRVFLAHNRSRLDDPVEILPELLARLEAKIAAREEVQRLLRKAMT
jgi:hypothetical protein